MRFSLLCDAHQDAGLDKVLFRFSDLGLKRFFEERNYGDTLAGITIVLMCQNPALNIKQRIRHSKKEKKLYMDIMLDLDQFKQLSQEQRERIVAAKMFAELVPVLKKYKFGHFDVEAFEADLGSWLKHASLL
ncbi:MAG TPA: hypothetical protein VF008_19640 [Niastella sp.]